MLIEIWERLRGYDKWTQTEATIRSSDLEDVDVGIPSGSYCPDRTIDEWQSFCDIAWTDASGTQHTAEYSVSEDSPLFQLYEGQKVILRYNPADPDHYYLRGVLRSKVLSTLKWRVVPALGIVLFLFLLLFHIAFCSH